MAITEVILTLFLKLFALGFFFRGFTLSSYQRPLYLEAAERELTTTTPQ